MAQNEHPPKYCRQNDKHGARAFVEVGGVRLYLGEYGSEESRERYVRVLAERKSSTRFVTGAPAEVTIIELCAAFWEHAQRYYRRSDGTATWEQSNPPNNQYKSGGRGTLNAQSV